MTNIFEGGKRFDPDQYIKTKSGSVLAFVKLLEAIAAGIGIIALVSVSARVSQLSRELLYYISQFSSYLPASFSRVLIELFRNPLLILTIILMLIILDGIGVLMMRYGSSGGGLVRFVHTIRWIAYIIEILCLIVGMVRFVLGLHQTSQAFADVNGANAAIGALGITGWVYFLCSLINLLFYCNYHHDIRVVLKTVQQERSSRRISKVGKNHLAGRSTWFAWGSGLWFICSAFLFIYPIVSHENLLSTETLRQISKYIAPIALSGINFIIALLVFLKYLCLRICMRNFNKMHK